MQIEVQGNNEFPFGDQFLKEVTITAPKPLWLRKQEYLQHPEQWSTTSEIDPLGRPRVIGMSGTDPIGEFVVANAALNPIFNAAGKAALYGLGRAGSNWARAKLISGTLNKSIPNTPRILPIELGQVGWGPRQLFEGYHASDNPNLVPDFWKRGWSQINHNAPYGFYAASGKAPESGFLTSRTYLYPLSIGFRKPMVQVGEIPTSQKNATRNMIERFAQDNNADGIIYQGIADNQMENQIIAKTLNPDTKIYLHTPRYKSSHEVPLFDSNIEYNPDANKIFRHMIKSAEGNLSDYHYSDIYRQLAKNAGFESDEDFYRLLKQYQANIANTRWKSDKKLLDYSGETFISDFTYDPEITVTISPYLSDYETMLHELMHASTANLYPNGPGKKMGMSYIQKATDYNNSIRPFIDLNVAKKSGISMERADYLSGYQELTARAKQIALAAFNNGVSVKDFVLNPKNHTFRPLSSLMEAYNLDDIIKYSSNALSITPAAYVGSKVTTPTTLHNKSNK